MGDVPEFLIPAIREVVHELAAGNYEGLAADGRAGRLTAGELREAVRQYGRTLVELPDEGLQYIWVYEQQERENTWGVDVDLWTAEEGRSDLTLSLLMEQNASGVRTEIENLHVL
ncbi:MAG: hypothetical protein QOH49_548 [Acidobacteriota bacterium]|jgi:hypothetical protein|nr:hypothetical protein [Acidobacteriota bacterium]